MAELFMQRRFWKACYGNATILALHTQVSRCPFSIYMYNLSNPNPDNCLVSLGIIEAKFPSSLLSKREAEQATGFQLPCQPQDRATYMLTRLTM